MIGNLEVITEGTTEMLVTVDQGQVLEQVPTGNCQEYDHFVRDCSVTQADREVEQIQQMFNMDEEQTLLQTPLTDTNQARWNVNTIEAREHLNV